MKFVTSTILTREYLWEKSASYRHNQRFGKKGEKNQEHTWQEILDVSEEQSEHPGPSHAYQNQRSTISDITSESNTLLLVPGNKNQPNNVNENDLA